ncbi:MULTISPECIES: DUF7155 family protein [Mycolicibacterium]|jgi:hypothetical protein|nr:MULTISPECIES: hypothetical protein [Mycolicibacterium]MCV7130525.1 hypothetical protein [Mycolicibacterium vanbaalenii PYR-1]MDN4519701.1 hypothetical protein [Mycolicibacterium austroafricanum]MDW5614525.1 hypothetical protein [Mycolicibacterium sp. D5.8-2]QRZ05125.1 hypothetical protein JN090_19355 [Mycolicibacterium austroafricanum]QZT60062.1 hypothetical protein JN084_18845 [Mycolicibacterium austroafricanum]
MLVDKIQTNKTRLIAGAIAAAAVAVPLYTSLTTVDAAPEVNAGPQCLAWFGNKEDGNCLSYSNGTGATIGTPQIGFGDNGFGFYTGPLLPGTTISQGIGGN